MKNLIHRPVTRLGMPYHGLVTDGELTTPGGPLAVSHVASVEGAIVFKTRNPPGNNPNAAQAALDTAQGWEWRDYAILNSQFRSIGDGATQLGEANWLYCDQNNVVWDMEVVLNPAGGVSPDLTVEIWRRRPFGRFRFGLDDYAFADEMVGSWTFACPQAQWETGSGTATIAPYVVAAFARTRGAGIVPSLHGDQVHIHILSPYTYGFPETQAYWSLEFYSCIAIVTFDIAGDGNLYGDGSGIIATPTNQMVYPWFTYQGEFDIPADSIDPWPINDISTLYTYNCSGANLPTGPGETCNENCEAEFTHFGTQFAPRQKSYPFNDLPLKNEIKWTEPFELLRYGSKAFKLEIQQLEWDIVGDNWSILAGQGAQGAGDPEMSLVAEYVSATNDGGSTWYWDLVSQTRVCSAWTHRVGHSNLWNSYYVDIEGDNTPGVWDDEIWVKDDTTNWQNSVLGVGTDATCGCISWQSTDGWPSPSSGGTRTVTWSEPYSIDETDTGSYADGLEHRLYPIFFPGIIGYVIKHLVPGATSTVRHRGKIYGIGSDNTLTEIDSWDITEADLVIRFPWTSVAWQPETKQFNVQTDGSTLVKYI